MKILKEKTAIARLKAFAPETEPYYLCYSGGKDSDVIRILAQLAQVKHEVHHNLTSVDAPETVRYVKSIPNIMIDIPKDKNGKQVTMWRLIVKAEIPPTRLYRYCCEKLKEQGGKGRMKITGVRVAESANRAKKAGMIKILGKPKTVEKMAGQIGADYEIKEKALVMNMDNDENRRLVEHCYRTTSTMLNPIIDWTDDDVWSFLKHYGCQSNPLYQCGKKRIGCIGCPMQGSKGMQKDFYQYPKYKKFYIRAFDKMLAERENKGKTTDWKSGIEVYDWWTGFDSNQLSFFDDENL